MEVVRGGQIGAGGYVSVRMPRIGGGPIKDLQTAYFTSEQSFNYCRKMTQIWPSGLQTPPLKIR
jgi:hypothetical protein